MKICPKCKAEIDDNARFCLSCMTSLDEKEQILPHKKKKPQWLVIIVAIAAALLILALVLWGTSDKANSDKSQTNSTTTENQAKPTDPFHTHDFSAENAAAEYRKSEASCTSPAIFYYSCTCGEMGDETFAYGGVTDHTLVTKQGYAATCKSPGLTDGTYCSACGAEILAQTHIPVVGHSYDSDQDESCNFCNYIRVLNCKHTKTVKLEAVSPTCTSGGFTEGERCALCEEVLTPQTALALLGHNEVIDKAVAPTCTVDGKSEGKHCSRCGLVLVYQQNIIAKGHSFDAENVLSPCSVCGAPPPHTHKFSEKNTAIEYQKEEASCLAPASYYYSCACGTKGTETFSVGSKGEHNIVTEKGYPSACETPGVTDSTYCSVCQHVFSQHLELEVSGHTFAAGDESPTCLVCGEEGTVAIQMPESMLISANTFRIDSITYTIIRSKYEEKWQIRISLNCTNLSSAEAYLSPTCSMRFYDGKGNFTGVQGSNYACYIQPNKSGTCEVAVSVPLSSYGHKLVIS